MSSACSVYICTYSRGKGLYDRVKPYHWEIFVLVNPTNMSGYAHQLRGHPGDFHYDGPESVKLEKSASVVHELQIGEIPFTELGTIERILQGVPIIQDENSDWNCQDWTMVGLQKFSDLGWIWKDFSGSAIKQWVKEPET